MIPEEGNRHLFKRAVLTVVETAQCMVCDRMFTKGGDWRYRQAICDHCLDEAGRMVGRPVVPLRDVIDLQIDHNKATEMEQALYFAIKEGRV